MLVNEQLSAVTLGRGYRARKRIINQWLRHSVNALPGRSLTPPFVSRGRPRGTDGRGNTSRHAGCSTSVISDTSTLPRVSGLNSSVTTKAAAAPVVATSIGMVKPSGWLAAK